jgi:hypothetical protein
MTRRALVATAVAVTGAGAIAFAVYLSLDPDNYFFYRPEDRAGWRFSLGYVLLVCGIMLAEAVIWGVTLLSLRPGHLWLRCLLALAFVGPVGPVHPSVHHARTRICAFPSSLALAGDSVPSGDGDSVRHNACVVHCEGGA